LGLIFSAACFSRSRRTCTLFIAAILSICLGTARVALRLRRQPLLADGVFTLLPAGKDFARERNHCGRRKWRS
jgi:hypothetical protein